MAVTQPDPAAEGGARLLMFSAITSAGIGLVSVVSNLLLHHPRFAWVMSAFFALAGVGASLLAAFGFARLRARVAFALLLSAAGLSLVFFTLRMAHWMPEWGSWQSTLLLVTRLGVYSVGWYLGCCALLRPLRAAGAAPGGGVIALVALSLAWGWVEPLASMLRNDLAFGTTWQMKLLVSATLDLAGDVILIVAFALAAQAFARSPVRAR